MLYRGSELKDQFERGEFHPLPPAGLMKELKLIMENVHLPDSERMISEAIMCPTISVWQQHSLPRKIS